VADLEQHLDQARSDLAWERARRCDTEAKLVSCRRSQARMLDELEHTRAALRRLIDAAELAVAVPTVANGQLEIAIAFARRALP
jgi:uncharacterized protein YlxW (UPF0749 family)